jgi:hypothetical protein
VPTQTHQSNCIMIGPMLKQHTVHLHPSQQYHLHEWIAHTEQRLVDCMAVLLMSCLSPNYHRMLKQCSLFLAILWDAVPMALMLWLA